MADEPRLEAIVSLVMEKVGASNARQLSDALGMTDIDRERRVQRWLTGESTPRFAYLMTMLSAARLLTPEAERAWRGDEPDAARAARDAAAAAPSVGEIGRAAQARQKRGTG